MKISVLLGGILGCLSAAPEAAKQRNMLFILTDDQGKYIGGLEHMPKLQVRAIYLRRFCSFYPLNNPENNPNH